MDLSISHQDVLSLLLERKKLLESIEVNGNACTERHTEHREHHPDFVLYTELIPPHYGPSIHRRGPFVLCNMLRRPQFALNLDLRAKKIKPESYSPETWPR